MLSSINRLTALKLKGRKQHQRPSTTLGPELAYSKKEKITMLRHEFGKNSFVDTRRILKP